MTNDSIRNSSVAASSAENAEQAQLCQNVREAIACLPMHFRTETRISAIMATDLHTLHTVLGATIEEQVVRTLNQIRNTWDPDDQYALYSFVRQAQTFPDVLLRRMSDGDVLLGIELKGWYLLAKEREPSLRFQVIAAACSEQDMIVFQQNTKDDQARTALARPRQRIEGTWVEAQQLIGVGCS